MEKQAQLLEAVRRGDASALAHLLGRCPELVDSADENGKTGLHWAAELDLVEVSRILLDAGADIEARTSWGASPLDWSATMGGVRVGELLISRGASGLTLVVAAGLGMLDRIREVIESETDLFSQRRRGAPNLPDDHWPVDSAHLLGDVVSDAMYAAARNGHTQVVEFLLEAGAAVDAKGVFGATALHWAAINGHARTVQQLLARGADLAIRDRRFDATPAEWAEEGGHPGLAETLRRKGPVGSP